MKIYIGADHRGYKLKEKLFDFLVDEGYETEDFGAYEYIKEDDYTIFAEKVGSVVGNYHAGRIQDNSKKDTGLYGILICGSGVGVDVVANKFDGVRASLGKSTEQVKAGRNDDDMNVLAIAADFTDENEAKEMVKVFLETEFSGEERYKKRLEEIKRIEANN